MSTHLLWEPRINLATGNVLSRMEMKSAIAALQICKRKILKKIWGTLLKRLVYWKNHARTIGDWISLVGREGMTNYTQLMISGHIVYYLKYWRNVHR
jgi:hypothetical protein